jgi:hypothetical protein
METTINDNLYCYVELPLFTNGSSYIWNETNSANFVQNILERGLCEPAPIESRFEMKSRNYCYNGGHRNEYKFPTLCLKFSSLNTLTRCENMLNNPIKTQEWGYIFCRMSRIWESNIYM